MTEFKKELPIWNTKGIKPNDSLIMNGWQANQKPAADYFNWLHFTTAEALKELQEKSALNTALENHKNNKLNPHSVTADQVGLGNLINEKQATNVEFNAHISDNVKHIEASERTKWNGKAEGVHRHTWVEIDNIPTATLSQKGIVQLINSISSTDNSSAATPNSVKQAYDRGSTGISDAAAVKKITEDHIANKSNPHGTNKGHVGLGNVENYEIASVSEAQTGTVINKYMTPLLVFEAIKTLQAVKSVNGKTGTVVLSKTDVGLSNVDNIQQATKVEFNGHINNKANPHGVTTEQIGTYGKSEIDSKVNSAQNTVQTNLTTHINNKSNPHDTNKSDVGLGNVENVKQASKTEFDAHANNKSNPHGVTAAQTGAYTIAQTNAEINKYIGYVDNRNDNQSPSWYMLNWPKQTRYEFKIGNSIGNPPYVMNGYALLETKVIWNSSSGGYPVQIAYAANGNGSAIRYGISETKWSAWLASETTAGAQAKATVVQNNLNTHVNNKSNPHGTTKTHVGLGSVDNVQQATKAEFNAHNTDNIRHITSTERSNWNGKATTAVATHNTNGLMNSEDKKKLDNIYNLSKGEKIWSGAKYPISESFFPSKKLSECENGWIIVLQNFASGSSVNKWDISYHFIEKNSALSHSSENVKIESFNTGGASKVYKQIYIDDSSIKGHETNGQGTNALQVISEVWSW